MKVHYNYGGKEKIINDILSITVIDSNSPVIASLEDGNEFAMSLDNIEAIIDEKVFEKGINDTPRCKNCLYKEICKTYNSISINTLYDGESTCKLFKDRNRFVEVVRCENCKYRVEDKGRVFCARRAMKACGEWCGLSATNDNHFCGYGKRKEDSDA